MSNILTVAIIDRHPILRAGLGVVLKNEYRDIRILESHAIGAFYERYPHETPTLFIVGYLGETTRNPLVFIRLIKKWYKGGKIIIYEEEKSDIVDFLQAGVNGYILKQAGIPELLGCIKEVLAGKTYLNHNVTLELLMGLSTASKGPELRTETRKDTHYLALTPREHEIAHYLSNGMGTSAIARNLDRKSSTISTIKKNIYRKMRVSSIVELRRVLGCELDGENLHLKKRNPAYRAVEVHQD